MNYDQISDKTYTPAGAFEINLGAREQEKYLNAMEAAWVSETSPARGEKHNGIRVFFAGLQAGLLSTSSSQLVSVNHK